MFYINTILNSRKLRHAESVLTICKFDLLIHILICYNKRRGVIKIFSLLPNCSKCKSKNVVN